MPNIKQQSVEQLYQRLDDIEKESKIIKDELNRRLEEKYPVLAGGVSEAFRKAFSAPSLMERNRIK